MSIHKACGFTRTLVLLACSTLAISCVDDPPGQDSLSTTSNAEICDEFSGQFVNVELQGVLEQLARQCGLELVLDESLREQITVTFTSIPFHEVVGKLLADRSYGLYLSAENEVKNDKHLLWVYARSPEPLEDVFSTQGEIADRTFPGLFDDELAAKISALDALVERRDADLIQQISPALLDSNPQMREEALDVFSDFGAESDVVLLEPMLLDEAATVREAAAYTIANIGGGESRAILERALYSAPSDRDRETLQDALEVLEEDESG